MVTGPEFRLSLPVALVQNQVSENWHAQAMSGSNNGVQCSSKTNRGAAARVLCKQLVPDICFFFFFFFYICILRMSSVPLGMMAVRDCREGKK